MIRSSFKRIFADFCQYGHNKVSSTAEKIKNGYRFILEERSFVYIPEEKSKIGDMSDSVRDTIGSTTKLSNKFGNIIARDKITSVKSSFVLYNPKDIEKVYKYVEKQSLDSILYFREKYGRDVFNRSKGLSESGGKEWYNFSNKVNQIMIQAKMNKQYVHSVDDKLKEFVQWIRFVEDLLIKNKISANISKKTKQWSSESATYLAINAKLSCFSDDLSDDFASARLLRLLKRLSAPNFKATRAYEIVTLGQYLIEKAMIRIEQRSESLANDEFNEVKDKLLKIGKNAAFVMALDILFPGIDTTSKAFIIVLYHLANKINSEKIREETFPVLPVNDDFIVTEEEPHFKICIKEAILTYLITTRILTKNAMLPGYQIFKGTHAAFLNMIAAVQEGNFVRPQEYLLKRRLGTISTPITHVRKLSP